MKFQFASGSRPLDGFTIKRGIGRGGFGEVYFALSDAGKEVALKRVQRNLEIELRGVSQCLNLKHANLVSLFDIRRDQQDETWVVMEYVAGDNLRQTLDQHPQGLPQQQVVHWMRGILAGVAYLHDQGIVHRDLKPGNIFEDYGAIKIGDYGLSKSLSASRRSGQTESIGTAHYMAPEIGNGTYGKGIDLYAVGVMLFEMLTGHLPFDGESSQEILMKHLTKEPDLSQVPPQFRVLLKNALQKDPALRIGSAQEFLRQLQAIPLPVASTASPILAQVVTTGIPVAAGRVNLPVAAQVAYQPVRRPSRLLKAFGGFVFTMFVLVGLGVLSIGLLRFSGPSVITNVNGGSTTVVMRPAVTGIGLFVLGSATIATLVFSLTMGIRLFTGDRKLALAGHVPASPPTPTAHVAPASWPVQHAVGSFQNPVATYAQSWDDYLRGVLAARSYSERTEEWIGSLLLSALVIGVTHGMIWLIRGEQLRSGALQPLVFLGWSYTVSTLGAWALLTVGKFSEGGDHDPIRRRGINLLIGLSLGAVAIVLSQFLLLDLPAPTVEAIGPDSLRELVNPHSLGRIIAAMGAVFGTIGWWKQTDPLRERRISIGRLFLVGLAVWLWTAFLAPGEPIMYIAPLSISLATQFAAPWIPTQRRNQLRRAMQEQRGYRR